MLRLYRTLPKDGVVICFDEHGPISPIPHSGWGWARRGLPQRIPANYRKGKGVRFFFGAFDVAKDQLFGRWYAHKTGANVLDFFKWVRARYKDAGRIYLIQDNLKPHFTPDIRSSAKDNDVALVPIPTYASWLNLIEAEFRQITEFVISNSDHQSHEQIELACSAYLRRRNLDARRNFDQRSGGEEGEAKTPSSGKKARSSSMINARHLFVVCESR